MRQIVARMLNALDPLHVFLIITVVLRQHLNQRFRGVVNVRGHLREEREVLFFTRQQLIKH